MRPSAIFGNTLVAVSQSFLKKMPPEMNKSKFFEEFCVGLKSNFKTDGDFVAYSLEGYWEAVVNAQEVLQTHFDLWGSQKQSEAGNEDITSNHVKRVELSESSVSDEHNGRIVEQEVIILMESPIKDFHQELEVVRSQEKGMESSVENEGNASSLMKSTAHEQGRLNENQGIQHDQNKSVQTSSKEKIDESKLVLRHVDTHNTMNEVKSNQENEINMDIQLEHNYNHCNSVKVLENFDDDLEPSVENEIYMDIKISKPHSTIFADPELPVTLVVAKEDEQGVEVLQLERSQCDSFSPLKTSKLGLSQNENCVRMKQLRKRYEQETPFRYFCHQCSFKTKRQSHIRKHSMLHEKVCTIYSCDQCDFSTIRASHLKRHTGTHQSEKLSCPDCSYTTYSEDLLTKHKKSKHTVRKEGKVHRCLQCTFSTASEKILSRHLIVHTRKKSTSSFKCNLCSYQTPSSSNYHRHMSAHKDERPFMCPICGLRFRRSDTLQQHQIKHVSKDAIDKVYECQECKKILRSGSALQEHQLTHKEGCNYLCEICAASFKTRDSQRRHFNQKHIHDKTNSCLVCSKSFSSKYIMKRHMKLHDQSKPCNAEPNVISSYDQSKFSPSSKVWCNTVEQSSSDVQVIFVHQESAQSELPIQEGPLYQVASSINQEMSVIPVEYVIPVDGSVPCIVPREEEIVAVTFVPADS